MAARESGNNYRDRLVSVLGLASAIVLLASLYSGNDERSHLEKIMERGSITMITRNSATAYYLGPHGYTGFEYDLVSLFAGYLGVDLVVRTADQFNRMFPMLDMGSGDLVAANVARTEERSKEMKFGPAYESVTVEVVYRSGSKRPRSIEDLIGNRVRVIAGSSYEFLLSRASVDYPDIKWSSLADSSIEDLLAAVTSGEIDYTVIDSNILKMNQRYFPRIRRGFTIGGPQDLAWVFPSGSDDSLRSKAEEFFAMIESDNRLADLKAGYYEYLDLFDRADMFTLMGQINRRLPPLLPIFREVALAHDMDWRLLAAMGYQESHWDPDAVSKTGVRGIMMLTQQTARQLGINNRLDPGQSIEGGARYLKGLLKSIPERIAHPDRLWLALAAYNIGMGHLEDARVLADRAGKNPDLWEDVKQFLPLLSIPKWYSQTRYGYARGYEALQYVENIRSYIDILTWLDSRSDMMGIEPPIVTT
jgi:membrane-bound lytic murein transglycosylase F